MRVSFSKFVTMVIGEKAQWRRYKARAKELPAPYREAIGALERYLMFFGTGGGGTDIFEDLIDLFEQSAASGTPIRDIVGEDPVEFIELFVRNYASGSWILRERHRLTEAIARAAGEDTGATRGADG